MKNKKIGRPVKLNDSTLERIAISLAEKGHIDKAIAEIIGISESCLNQHKLRSPEFKKLLLEAKENYDKDIVESALLERALGNSVIKETQTRTGPDGKKTITVTEKSIPPDPSCISLFLKNRDPLKWCKEKQNLNLEIEPQQALSREEMMQILRDDPFLKVIEN